MAPYRVFISYSSKDRPLAEEIHRLLAQRLDVWRDQTQLESDWSREIAYALAERDILCLIWSKNSAASKWVKHEWLTARALEKRIIPIMLPEAPDLPEPLQNLHGIPVQGGDLKAACKTFVDRALEYDGMPVKHEYKILS